MAQLGVTATDVINALATQNNVYPAGRVGGEPVPSGQQLTYTVRTQGRLVDEKQFEDIILRSNPDGSVLHLRDVARVQLGSQNYDLSARYNGAPAGIMGVYQLPGSNAVQTAAAVRARLEQLSHSFPAGLQYAVTLDTTKAVTAGIHDITVTLAIALALVMLVRTRLADWRLHSFSVAGLFHQHPFAVWTCAGDRPGSGRRHHRCRGC